MRCGSPFVGRGSLGLLTAALLLCGCDRVETEQTRPSPEPSTGDAVLDASAQSDVDEAQRTAAAIARLSADIDAAIAERTQLQQQREAIDARLTAHQEQGMALLDTLKAQMQERASDNRDAAVFKAQAREKLEAALAQDDALTASLAEIDARIAEANATIARLGAERKALLESAPTPSGAGRE